MQRYWFKRKLYGYGWEPATWEGWLSLAVFIAIGIANWVLRYQVRLEQLTDADGIQFVVETFILVGLLILLCVRTGESPRWQWGKRKDDN